MQIGAAGENAGQHNFTCAYSQAETPTFLRRLAFGALWLLVFAIPWENAIWLPDYGTATRLIGMTAVVLGLLSLIEKGRIRFPCPAHVVMILFTMWACISYLWSPYLESTALQVSTYCQLLVMAWLIWQFGPERRDQERLMQAYIFGTFISSIDILYQFITHHEVAYQRYTGAGLNADQVGLIMAVSIPISYYLLIHSRKLLAGIYGLQLALGVTAILLSAGRGGFLAGLVALSIVPVTSKKLSALQKLTILGAIFLAVASSLFLVPTTSWDRMSTIPEEVTHGSMSQRRAVWSACWELFRTHPFIGVGAGAFRESSTRFLPVPVIPHNTFLGVLAELGIIGFGQFCVLLVLLLLCAKDMPALPRKLWMVFLAVWVVAASDLTWDNGKSTWFFFGLLIAQWAAMVRKEPARVKSTLLMSVRRTSPNNLEISSVMAGADRPLSLPHPRL